MSTSLLLTAASSCVATSQLGFPKMFLLWEFHISQYQAAHSVTWLYNHSGARLIINALSESLLPMLELQLCILTDALTTWPQWRPCADSVAGSCLVDIWGCLHSCTKAVVPLKWFFSIRVFCQLPKLMASCNASEYGLLPVPSFLKAVNTWYCNSEYWLEHLLA